MCYSTSWTRQIILMSERQLISCIIQWVSSHLAVQPSYPYYHQNKMKENLSHSFFIQPCDQHFLLFSVFEISALVLYVLCSSDSFADPGYKLWLESVLHIFWKWHVIIIGATAYHESREVRVAVTPFKQKQ